jgi:hypothetical protein
MISSNFTANILTTFQSTLGSVDRSVANINGFTRWTWIPIVTKESSGTKRAISSNEIPSNLIPTREFQIAAETSTCTIILPWGGFADPFSEFFLSGGTTGTLLGAINGLNVVEQSFEQKSVANYGFGEEYAGPEIGYCLGTLFKEKLYSKIFAENIFNIDSLSFCDEQLLFRSSFERFYLHRGLIKSFTENSDSEYEIIIETKSEITAIEPSSSISDTITLYKRDSGKSTVFKINSVRGQDDGGDIIMNISPSSEISETFSSRDYFFLSNPWYIQDPYLIDGKLKSIRQESLPSGTYSFFSTDQNEFVFRCYVTGIYIRRKNISKFSRVSVPSKGIGVVVSSSSGEEEQDGKQYVVRFVDVRFEDSEEITRNIPVSDVYVVTTNNIESDSSIKNYEISKLPGNPIDMPGYDEDITYDSKFYWSFAPTSLWEKSDIYNDKKRSINIILKNDFGDAEYKNIDIEEVVSENELNEYYESITDESTDYFKIELSISASSTRTNLYDNSLVGSFLVQENDYFEIIGQEGVNIIDVSPRNVKKTSYLNFHRPFGPFEYILLQEFGWKFKEWEMFSTNRLSRVTEDSARSTQRSFLFNGEIISINHDSKTAVIKVDGENSATTSSQMYYNLGDREYISFYERFVDEYSHDSLPKKAYNKYQGWYMHSSPDGANRYQIKNITIDSEKRLFFDLGNYEISIQFTEIPENFLKGDIVYCTFDRTQYQRQGAFRGTQIINTDEINPIDVNNRLCLDGFWLSPRYKLSIPEGTRLGLCGGKYWGLGDRAPDNNYALIFMRSPRSGLGISSIMHAVSNINYVFFYDYFTNNLSLRMGNIKYSENPRSYSISVGLPDSVDTVNVNEKSPNEIEINLDNGKYATKLINFIDSEYPRGDNLILFSTKEKGQYYGTVISGQGDMDLIGFNRIDKEQEKDEYKYKGEFVSPYYEYSIGSYSSHEYRDLYISALTSESPIIMSSDGDLSKLKKVIVQYSEFNQHIQDSNFIDIIKTDYDEFLLFMGRQFPPFRVEGSSSVSNSTAGSSRWVFPEGIFGIGSRNLGGFWGTPGKYIDEDNQYGVLFLDGAKYLCSLYHNVSNNILLFFVSAIGEQVYLGCLIINNSKISSGLLKCEVDGDYRDFYWRPPLVPASSYIPNISIGDSDEPSSSPEEEEGASKKVKDEFVIIASESLKEAQIEAKNVTDFGTVSCAKLKNGRIILLYDSLDGINMIFSKSSGVVWGKSEINLVSNASSGLYIDPFLFFITSSGISYKIISSSLISRCMDAVEGNSEDFIEGLQSEIDSVDQFNLNTGEVPDQKFSGFYNDFGQIQIFYYDSEGKLSSFIGSGSTWEKAINF